MADNELELGTVRPVNTPEIALGALLLAHDTLGSPHAPALPSPAVPAAQVSSAASLLMIAELLQELVKEIKQLRGILCTRRPPL